MYTYSVRLTSYRLQVISYYRFGLTELVDPSFLSVPVCQTLLCPSSQNYMPDSDELIGKLVYHYGL